MQTKVTIEANGGHPVHVKLVTTIGDAKPKSVTEVVLPRTTRDFFLDENTHIASTKEVPFVMDLDNPFPQE